MKFFPKTALFQRKLESGLFMNVLDNSLRWRDAKNFVFGFTLIPLLSGCTTFAMSGVTTAGYSMAEERTVGHIIDDSTIATQINSHFLQKDVNELFQKVSVTVTEGRVLLTGSVNKPESRVEAVRLAWKPRGVKEVINEIQVSAVNPKQYAQDVFISAQVKSRMVLNRDVRSINYNIETVNGVVYLIGLARGKQELEKVTDIASRVKGVRRVVSHVQVLDQESIKKG